MKSKGRKSCEQKKFRELRECSALTVTETRNEWLCKCFIHRVQYNLFTLKLTFKKTTKKVLLKQQYWTCLSFVKESCRDLQSSQSFSISCKKTNWFLHRSFAHRTVLAYNSSLLLTLFAEIVITESHDLNVVFEANEHKKRRLSTASKSKTTEFVLIVLVLRLVTVFLRLSIRCVLFSFELVCFALFLHRCAFAVRKSC